MVTADVLRSPALPILLQLEAGGVRFRLDGEQVLVSPRGVLTPEQREVFGQNQAAVRAFVAVLAHAGVQDRVVEFRRQFAATAAPGVPGFLFRDVPYVRGRCFSCADALPVAKFGRCWKCSLSWRLAAGVAVDKVLADALDGAKMCA